MATYIPWTQEPRLVGDDVVGVYALLFTIDEIEYAFEPDLSITIKEAMRGFNTQPGAFTARENTDGGMSADPIHLCQRMGMSI